ncbi:hypothetical protein ACFL39_01025 [Gemmatimonadota bacterium]
MRDLTLKARSIADDLAYTALGDVWSILNSKGDEPAARLIGGQMVSLHAHRYGLDLYRESLDVDVGFPQVAARDPWFVELLTERGYSRKGGNSYTRPVDDLPEGIVEHLDFPPEAQVDILVAPYSSRARDNVHIGEHLTTSEVPGLAEALKRPSVDLSVILERLNGMSLQTTIRLPDEVSTLILRAHAWRIRGAGTDAIDLWRALEIAVAAGSRTVEFSSESGLESLAILERAFQEKNGLGMERLAEAQGLSGITRQRRHTRIKALIKALGK